MASSFRALRTTLEKHLRAIREDDRAALVGLDEDAPDDETADEVPDAEEVAEIERRALAAEERADIERLLDRIRACPPDSKLFALRSTLAALREAGHKQVMVFTQYTDTMDFLRDELRRNGGGGSGGGGDGDGPRLMCFSGRGGEIPAASGGWRGVGRDDAKHRFRLGEADLLLCTDAAAEGLNFQFCGALVNYDMPWNPMRVEQRIGRIDRLGQRYPVIRVVNLHYEGTVETDVYRALRSRIGLFEAVVGRLQPILARMPRVISEAVLAGGEDGEARRANVADAIDRQAHDTESSGGFDIDAVLGEDLAMPDRAPPPVTMDDLDRIISSPDLMPPGADTQPMGRREYGLLAPGNAGTAAGDDRPRLLRGARGERRAVVAGESAFQSAGAVVAPRRAAARHDAGRHPGRVTRPEPGTRNRNPGAGPFRGRITEHPPEYPPEHPRGPTRGSMSVSMSQTRCGSLPSDQEPRTVAG